MDQHQILLFGLCVGMAAFFSAGRTVADNMTTNVRGFKLAWLMLANVFMGFVGGSITVPITEIIGLKTNEWRLLIAALIGWMGLPEAMKYIRSNVEKKLEGSSPTNDPTGNKRFNDTDSGNPDKSVPVQKDS